MGTKNVRKTMCYVTKNIFLIGKGATTKQITPDARFENKS